MKALIKKSICFILYYSGMVNFFIKFVVYRKKNLPVVIINYHKITENIEEEINNELSINHPLGLFIKEMQFIKNWFDIVSFDEAVEILKNNKKLNKPAIAITFDDGFEDNYRLAFPILKKFNIPATIFLTTGLIGTSELPWVDKIGQAILKTQEKQLNLASCFKGEIFNLETLSAKRDTFSCLSEKLKELEHPIRINLIAEIFQKLGDYKKLNIRMLNWQQIQEMAEKNITFGAHTMTHPILSKMPIELAKQEIKESKLEIENTLAVTVKHFAYPNGRIEDFSEALKEYCQEIGFESVSTAVYGNNALGSDVYALKRLIPGINIPIFAVDLIREFLRNE